MWLLCVVLETAGILEPLNNPEFVLDLLSACGIRRATTARLSRKSLAEWLCPDIEMHQ